VHSALETFAQCATSLDAAGNRPDALATTVVLAELDREAGDLASATRHLETARSLGDTASMTENRYRWFVVAARVKEAEGAPDAALDLLDEAERRYLRGYFPEVRPIAAMKARLRIAQGDLDVSLPVTGDAGYLQEFVLLTQARLLLAQRDGGAALTLLDRLLEPAQACGREASVLEIRMLQALAHDAGGQRSRALETLEVALAAAPEPEGFVRLFLEEGRPLLSLLRDGRAGVRARRLLAAESPPASPLADPLSERELQVLRLLDTELSGPEIARELFISLNTLRTHTKRIFAKLDATSRLAAVRRAREHGLL
jgi:LuxR family maltose regulon positive regulatory protein